MTVEHIAAPVTHPEVNQLATESPSVQPVRAFAVTVEHLGYALVLVIALAARLFALGNQLYTSAEATVTWPAWLEAMALPIAGAPQPSSALLHSLQVALFWLFDGGGADSAGNLLGRLPVALASALLVLLPYWWRKTLGHPTALALALLLAIDPWLITLGRVADAALLSTALALTAITALHHAQAQDESVRAASLPSALAAVALGLLVGSGAQAWPWLLVVAAWLLLVAPRALPALATFRNVALALAALTLSATTLLAQPEMVRAISASLAAFASRFGGGDYALGWAALRIVADQPLLLIASALGILVTWRNPAADVRLRLFLTVWLALGVTLLVLPGRSPYDLPLLGVPMAIFAAIAVGYGIQKVMRDFHRAEWVDALGLLVVLTLLAVGMLFWGASAVWSREGSTTDTAVTVVLLLAGILLVAVFAWQVSRRQALLVSLGVLLGLLLALSIASTVKLASPAQPSHPTGFFVETVYPDFRHLPSDVRTLSDRRKGDNRELPVLVINDASRIPDPLVGWTLRAMRNLRFVDSWQTVATYAGQTPPLVITAEDNIAVTPLNQYYLGSPYRTTMVWRPDMLPSLFDRPEESTAWVSTLRPWLRWFLYREATPGIPQLVNLWATRE